MFITDERGVFIFQNIEAFCIVSFLRTKGTALQNFLTSCIKHFTYRGLGIVFYKSRWTTFVMKCR